MSSFRLTLLITVARWDGIDLHPHNVESNGTESVSIGYVLDDW